MYVSSRNLVFPLVLALAGGCGWDDRVVVEVEDAGADGDADTDADTDTDADADGDAGTPSHVGCDFMDILFIIDNSESMLGEQNNLGDSFPGFIQVLEEYRNPNDEPIEYRVGVTTSGVNREWNMTPPVGFSFGQADGALVGKTSCGLADPWIDSGDAGANELAEDFSCMAKVGMDGSAYEMHFAALELALGTRSGPGGPNEGFYRRDHQSLLVVVMITDEDDCSIEQDGFMGIGTTTGRTCNEQTSIGLYTPAQTKTYLDTVALGEDRYVVVGIAGPGPGTCNTIDGDAIYAERIRKLVDLTHPNSAFGSICEGDLWVSLQDALETITNSCDDLPPPAI